MGEPGNADPTVAAVALPVPLPEALWYTIPEPMRAILRPGQRVRVPLGPRRRVGVVLDVAETAPEDLRLRDIEDLLDLEPILSAADLDLARWIADYYLAPIGETVATLLPAGLAGGARRRLSLSTRGAFGRSREPVEGEVLGLLLESGPRPLLEVFQRWRGSSADESDDPLAAFLAAVHRLEERGAVRLEGERRTGARYAAAVELGRGSRDDLLERCGRSPKARQVVSILSEMGRPARVSELTSEADCGAGVVRRLVKLGVLRQFTQIENLDLDRHLANGGGGPAIVLRDDQADAVDALLRALDRGGFQPHLLRGVTGSGKTEVYLRAISHSLAAGRGALVLVPEIALVPSLAQALRTRFGEAVALLHSNLSRAERTQEWQRIRSGEATVVVGPRSAALAPLADLGLVVVDEEHDAAYKQDEKAPRYNARDVALVRAQRAGAVAVLASATPSLEALGRVESGRLRALTLTRRAGGAELPVGEIVDLRREPVTPRSGDVHFSERLDSAIRETASRGHQIILLRNRRGFAPVVLCRACGEDHRCPDCGLPRTLHWRSRILVCHYCSSRLPVPRRCGSCGAEALEPVGAGTERVEAMFRERFPDLTVDVLDRDATQRVGGVARILERFSAGATQVLIGTQMVAKGHHFPNVALTGVLSADTYLKFPDFRAVERTYALLTQVIGRAGRGEVPGRFVLQTFHPEHYAIQAVLRHDSDTFEREELEFRRKFSYPPYSRLVSLLFRDTDEGRAAERARSAARLIDSVRGTDVRMTGPAPAPLERLRGRWRHQILLRSPSASVLRDVLQRSGVLEEKGELVVDVDPQSLL